MYLTYDDYIDYGGSLDETAFNQLEFEARAKIDWWTFNRLQNETEFPEAVKRCMYKLITMLNAQNTDTLSGVPDENGVIHSGIVQLSNDGVSTSYNTLSAKEKIDTLEKDMKTTVIMYLQSIRNSLGHKLLYRGIYPDE